MKITIESIAHKDQRYPTLGDWQYIGDELVIRVSETGNRLFNNLLAMHELVEAILCKENRITEQQVDEWDMSHLDSEEPGIEHGCPYLFEHVVASVFEKNLAFSIKNSFGIWEKYEKTLRELNG